MASVNNPISASFLLI